MQKQNYLIHQLCVRQQFDEASCLIDQALRDSGEGGSGGEYALHVKALIARHKGNVSESLRLFQQATALDPHSSANLKQVGRSLCLLGKHRAAAEVYDEALRLDATDWDAWASKGRALLQLKDHAGALQCFHKANEIQPQDATFMQIGAVHMELGQLEAALATYAEALEHSPDNPDILTTLGITFLRLGDTQRAFDRLGSSLVQDPRNARTILAAGSIIQDHQDHDVALVKYRVAAAATPSSAALWNNIGMCFFGKQRYIAAASCLKRAAYLDPMEWLIAYNQGLVHLHTGQAASAFLHFSTAINLKPDFAHSYMCLGIALARLDDPDNAAAAYNKAISMDAAEPLFHLNYALMLHSHCDAVGAKQRLDGFVRLVAGLDEAARAALDPDMLVAARALEQQLGAPPTAAAAGNSSVQ